MPQGSRQGWLRTTFASVGVTLCVGLFGCNNTPDKPKATTTSTTGLPGTPRLDPSYGSNGATPTNGANGVTPNYGAIPGSNIPNRTSTGLPTTGGGLPTTGGGLPTTGGGLPTTGGGLPTSYGQQGMNATPNGGGSNFSTANQGYNPGTPVMTNPAAGIGGGLQPGAMSQGSAATRAPSYGGNMTTPGGNGVGAIPGVQPQNSTNQWPSMPDVGGPYAPLPPNR